MAIPVALAALAAGQGLLGLGQTVGAANKRRRARAAFDEYEVPDSVMNMLDLAHGMSSQTEIPGADIYRSRAKSAFSQGIESASSVAESSVDALGAIQQMFGSYNNFEQNLAIKGAEMQRAAKERELGVLSEIGQYESQQWMYNELFPYMQAMNEAAQIEGAGGQNIQSALSSGMSLGMANMDMNAQQQMFNDYKSWILGPPASKPTMSQTSNYWQDQAMGGIRQDQQNVFNNQRTRF